MQLDFKTIEAITCGVSYISETQDGIQFHRFNKQEEEYYDNSGYPKPRHYTNSGIKLCFSTDSTTLRLRICALEVSLVTCFSQEIFVNGKKIGELKNFSEHDLPVKFENMLPVKFPLGHFEGEYDLGHGVKEVCIVLPWTVSSVLEALELEDGSSVTPLKRNGTLISYGDSITYGSFAMYPSNRYVARLSEALHVDEICKGVGGEKFCPELLSYAECDSPDYVVVAYGTNDIYSDFEDFKGRCMKFFKKISEMYKDASILVISPIWRIECKKEEFLGQFKQIEAVIKETSALYDNVKYISGYDLVPHDIRNFADAAVHPNDEGFEYYVSNLLKENVFDR